ncbi:hypothetical protein RSOLAG22IIIB_01302 [Rhizoctonia solani]|nr:hypothetical protein RSOLAG22IIIB_01302 [Rhizoctonia solani]
MVANISVIFHVSRMLASRKTRQNHSMISYLVPIFVLLIVTVINVVLTTIPLVAPSALIAVSAPGSNELIPALYNYSPSLIMLGFGVPISLVGLCILAGGFLIWAYGPSSCGDERADLYDMPWQTPNVRVQV